MRTAIITFAACCISTLTIVSCSKSNNDQAGKGGNATLTVQLQHHTVAKNIENGIVYIKYGATDVPSNGVYDDSALCSSMSATQTAVFSNLKNGNYFLYATGFDTSISQAVRGGGAYTVTQQAAQTYILAVSE